MRKSILGGLLAGAVLTTSLAACGTPVASSSDAEAGALSAPTAVADEPAAEADDAEADVESGVNAFGKTFTFADGVAITVTKPKKFKPTENVAGLDGKGTPVRMQVTIKNGSNKPYDPSMFMTTVMSGEAESEQLFDSGAHPLESSPSTKVLKGKTVKFDIGFEVNDPKDITLEATAGFEYDPAIYTNNG